MAEHENLEVPQLRMPEYLRGLKPPVTVEEALEYAEEHGAGSEILRFMEALPAAVFTSEEGIGNALGRVTGETVPHSHPEDVRVGEDGTSS